MDRKHGRYRKIHWLFSKKKYLGKYNIYIMIYVKMKTLKDRGSAKIGN